MNTQLTPPEAAITFGSIVLGLTTIAATLMEQYVSVHTFGATVIVGCSIAILGSVITFFVARSRMKGTSQ